MDDVNNGRRLGSQSLGEKGIIQSRRVAGACAPPSCTSLNPHPAPLYSLGWLRVRSLPRTVVSVGNLTVGGTGKTPTTIWLAGELKKLGYRVAILSRGYKRTGK